MLKSHPVQLIYVESPLQLLSAMDSIRTDVSPVFIVRNKNYQIGNIIGNSKFLQNQKIFLFNSLIGFILNLFKITFSYKVKNLSIGDIRSIYSLILFLMHFKRGLGLLDDGTYTISVDNSSNLNINLRLAFIKLPIIKLFLRQRKLTRYTLFGHKISRNYRAVHRSRSENAIKKLELQNSAIDDLSEFKITNSIIYVQSGLEGWVPSIIEKKLYDKLQTLARNKNSKLIVFMHRRTKEADIMDFITDSENVDLRLLKFPIEFYYENIDHISNTIVFPITTAIRTALLFMRNAKICLFKIEIQNFFDNRKQVVRKFYENVTDEARVGALDIEEIKI